VLVADVGFEYTSLGQVKLADGVTLNLQDVLDLSGGNQLGNSATSAKQWAVFGDAQDTAHIGTGWANSGSTQLLIDQAMVTATI
jgi:hypothetical protein